MVKKPVTIDIYNSYSRLSGVTPEQLVKIRNKFSYLVDPQAVFQGRLPRRKYMIDARGEFPTGILHRVWAEVVPETTIDHRKRPESSGTKSVKTPMTLYPDQLEAAEQAIKAHRAGIVMPTGSGKSMVIAEIIRRLNLKTLVVVPNIEIRDQLRLTLKAFFGNLDNISVENIDSNKLKKTEPYDVLIIDECHHVAAKTYQILNKKHWGDIYYRFFLSATFYRNQENEQLPFEGIAGQVAFRLSYQAAVDRGYIVPVEAFGLIVPKIENDYYRWPEVYSNLVVNNKVRNECIAAFMDQLDGSVLCLVKEIQHGLNLSELTRAPFANGQDEDSRQFIEKFNSGKIKALIATEGLVSEGVDTKPCEYVIIAGLGKAKSSFMQKVGRAVRRYKEKQSAKVILIKDPSHRMALNHYREQKKILLEEYGVEVIEFEP